MAISNKGLSMIRERELATIPGLSMLLGLITAGLVLIALFVTGVAAHRGAFSGLLIGMAVLGGIAEVLGLIGLFVINPNEAKVLQLFGSYVGTVRKPGLQWANPFYTKKR